MKRLLTVEHRDEDAAVLFVTNAWPHPGEPRYGIFAKRQVDSLLAEGLRCDVLFVRGFESPLAYLLAAAWLLGSALRRRYRLVHGHGGETLIPCLFFVGRPRIVSFCGDDLLGTPDAAGGMTWRSRVKRGVLRRLAGLTTATITKSREMERALPPRLRARNTVLPNGVDRELFSPQDPSEARARLDWPAEERVALFAADPELPRKRHGLALAACEAAGRNGTAVRLHVAHTVPPDLMPTLMSAADCLLMTSAIEGSPNVVKEALMCNLPVVATPAGDTRELLAEVDPSWLCAADAERLGEAVRECVTLRRRSNGRDRAAWLDQREIARRLLEIYDGLR